MNRALVQNAAAVLLLALLAAAVRLMFGADAGWVVFAGGLLALLARHARNLGRLLDWLRRPDPGDVPGASGLWDDAFALLHRRERDHAQTRQRIEALLVRYMQAGRALPIGVAVLDAKDRIQWCNERAEAYLGIDLGRDAGRPIVNLVRQPEFVKYVNAGEYSSPVELRTPRGSGAVLSVRIVTYDDSQKLLLARDVTQSDRLERMRRDFVANVSHELRTPLTVLIGFLETVRELKLDAARARSYLDMMSEQAARMRRILDDLLALSSLEASPEAPVDKRVGMIPLLRQLEAEAQSLSGGRHRISLHIEADRDLLGSESEIASALRNLVTNSIRYTPDGGEVRMRWAGEGQGASFAVQDTGIGIAPEHIPRLTERFYRVDRGRSRDSGGTGLGLSIVKHTLARHQADLEIESEPGRGSRFVIRFPGRRVVASVPETGVAA